MKKSALFVIVVTLFGFVSDNPAYQLYTDAGKQADYDDMMKDILEADIILFGEYHDNPICHWLQLEVTEDLFSEHGENLVLGAEMFESDNQLLMDEYLAGLISQSSFETEMRLWPNYETDYKPLVEFARENELPFVAANVPRRYASMVYGGGFDTLSYLSEEALQYMSPLPIEYDRELGCYQGMLEMSQGHGGENLLMAQALKDATMAHFIMQNWEEGKVLIHYNGAYHSDNHEAIEWYLKKANPDLKVVTLSTCSQEDVSKLEKDYEGAANYIICVSANMTSTH